MGNGVCSALGCVMPTTECAGIDATAPPAPVAAPSESDWAAIHDAAPAPARQLWSNTFPVVVAPTECDLAQGFATLTSGLGFVRTEPKSEWTCQVWTGIATDRTLTTAVPTQYCEMPLVCARFLLKESTTGSPHVDSPYCVLVDFELRTY